MKQSANGNAALLPSAMAIYNDNEWPKQFWFSVGCVAEHYEQHASGLKLSPVQWRWCRERVGAAVLRALCERTGAPPSPAPGTAAPPPPRLANSISQSPVTRRADRTSVTPPHANIQPCGEVKLSNVIPFRTL
ncbi:hypothetical protein RR48_12423 [Papilio machaon]|uniref:Uncharacterized protein n=1 Tax=Papilio machaon TaxID=76193 RepID=A0A194RN16_PAPMA|nr:hypothetical protein RR48_12423 [Papilio machaon]